MITIRQYRNLLNDKKTDDEIIQARIQYLEALCQNVARSEIEEYVKRKTETNK